MYPGGTEAGTGAAGGVHLTLEAVEAAVRRSWSIESCDPTDAPTWTASNPAQGQCAVTALVVRDLIGGQLLEAEVLFRNGTRQGFHYWNRLAGIDVDLTREQFTSDEVVQAPQVVEGPPQVPWISEEQYIQFRARVLAALQMTDPTAP
jgi:hypothetical protein